jgi:hypothetical protein
VIERRPGTVTAVLAGITRRDKQTTIFIVEWTLLFNNQSKHNEKTFSDRDVAADSYSGSGLVTISD